MKGDLPVSGAAQPRLTQVVTGQLPVLLGIGLVLLVLATYSNTFFSPLVLDDVPAIEGNKSIRSLSDFGAIFASASGTTVEGRPVANLSLAINYALGGSNVFGYHVVNVVIHLGATFFLYGVVRRTLRRIPRFSPHCTGLSWVVAALWALHPLQTESVTYIIQRVESLMGLFYLLTLYAFIRGVEAAPRGRFWWGISVAACWLGMGTKEVMVSAPLLVLLYDRTFLAGSFASAWRQRRGIYALLFGAWLFLGALLVSSWGHSNVTGFSGGVSWWHYLLTQCDAICTYLRLSFWPDSLIFDYGRGVIRDPWRVVPEGVFLTGMAVATVWAIVRRSSWGVIGAWFFATLAPSSSVVPIITQTAAEHRMYLPLAAVVIAFVLGLYRFGGFKGLIGAGVCVPLLMVATYVRNEQYRDPLVLWQDTVNKRPNNTRARNNLGNGLTMGGRAQEALPHFEAALAGGDNVDAELYANYAHALYALGRSEEAETFFRKALLLDPRYYRALTQLGNIAMKKGLLPGAVRLFEESLRIAPDDVTTRANLGSAYLAMAEPQKAAEEYGRVLVLAPSHVDAWAGLGNLAFAHGDLDEAANCFRRAIVASKGAEGALPHSNLARVYAAQGRRSEAQAEYLRALELDAHFVSARQNLASLLAQGGRYADALVHFEIARERAPNDAALAGSTGMAYELAGQLEKAVECYREALRLNPDHPFAGRQLERIRGDR